MNYELLKNQNLIGAVGELIVTYHLSGSFRTRTTSPEIIKKLNSEGKIPDNIADFLISHWNHFDIVNILYYPKRCRVLLYEVKTRKFFLYKLRRLFQLEKITQASYSAYEKAQALGIETRLILVRLHNDWTYTLSVKEFKDVKFWIDKRNKPFHGRNA